MIKLNINFKKIICFSEFKDSNELKIGGEITNIFPQIRNPQFINATRLYKTKSSITFKPLTKNWHLKNLKCECLIEPTVPSSLIVSDLKSVFVNCNLNFSISF